MKLPQFSHIFFAESHKKLSPWHLKPNHSSDFPSWSPCCWWALPMPQSHLMIEHALRALKVVSSPSPLICVTRCCSPSRLQQDLNGCLWRQWRMDCTRQERQPTVGEKDGNCLRKVSKHRLREQYGPNIIRPIDLFHKSQNAPVPCRHFFSERSLVGYGTGEFWDLCNWSIVSLQIIHNRHTIARFWERCLWFFSYLPCMISVLPLQLPQGWVFYANFHITQKLDILFDNSGINKSFKFTTLNQFLALTLVRPESHPSTKVVRQ